MGFRVLAVLMALSCSPAWGHDVAPDSVWTMPGDSLETHVTTEICWTPVDGAEGYQVIRFLWVNVVNGEITDKLIEVPVPWMSVPPDRLCATVNQLDGYDAPWGVLALHDHATAVRRCSWGSLKDYTP